jgi:hypothetical protein
MFSSSAEEMPALSEKMGMSGDLLELSILRKIKTVYFYQDASALFFSDGGLKVKIHQTLICP